MHDSPLLRASRELYVSALASDTVDVSGRAVDLLASILTEEGVAAGRRIFAEGEAVDQVYFMRYGRVRMERRGSLPWTLVGSAVFGAFEAALPAPYARGAVALEDVMVMRVAAESWLALLDEDVDLARLVVVEGLGRLAELEVQAWSARPELRSEVQAHIGKVPRELDFLDRVDVLASVPMLRSAGVQVLVDLAAGLTERRLERGETLHSAGVPSGQAFVVVEGEIVGVRAASDLHVTFGPGSLVCGASWLGQPQLAWRTRAALRTRVLCLGAERWFDAMEEHPQLLRATLGAISLTRDEIVECVATRPGLVMETTAGRLSWEDASH